jgi:hypothetical protein
MKAVRCILIVAGLALLWSLPVRSLADTIDHRPRLSPCGGVTVTRFG